ncbi:MAG TPA: AAA family ATPase [Gaiellaceae bacterium]|nr:AAA family ATPase [Gaiellaceae bacterium]
MTSTRIRALVALDRDVNWKDIEQTLSRDDGIEVVGVLDDLDDAWEAIDESRAELLLLACSGYSDRALYVIDGAVQRRPDRPVVVLTESSPDGFLRRVFEAGAEDVITLPARPEDVGFTLEKVLARKRGSTAGAGLSSAPLVCVLGPKGGTGKTLVATNLAVAMAARRQRVVLVDLDLQFGDLGLALGLSPEKTIYDLVKAGGSLDQEKLDGFLAKHPSGARVLMAPTRPDQASVITVEFLRDLYGVLRSMSDVVIVDTPPGFTPEVIASIDMSTHVCMVGMLDTLSLKNTKLGLETLDLMGYDPGDVTLILNRADSRVGITNDDVSAIVGRVPQVRIPSDRAIPRSVNEGTPIVLAHERSSAARAFRELADIFIREHEAKNPDASTNGFRKLLVGGRA